jgi:hypothetical protein
MERVASILEKGQTSSVEGKGRRELDGQERRPCRDEISRKRLKGNDFVVM